MVVKLHQLLTYLLFQKKQLHNLSSKNVLLFTYEVTSLAKLWQPTPLPFTWCFLFSAFVVLSLTIFCVPWTVYCSGPPYPPVIQYVLLYNNNSLYILPETFCCSFFFFFLIYRFSSLMPEDTSKALQLGIQSRTLTVIALHFPCSHLFRVSINLIYVFSFIVKLVSCIAFKCVWKMSKLWRK